MNVENSQVQRLLTAGFWLLAILSVFFVILSIAALKATGQIGAGAPATNVITVSGEGEVFAVPDIAEFNFSVVERRDTVEAAQEAAAEKTNEILDFLEDEDVDEDDIKTIGYNLYPRYEYRQERIECVTFPCPQPPGEQVLVGYEARQSIRVKVRDTEAAGGLLSGVGQRGATEVSGLSFTIDDEDELQREARKEAIEDAQTKAEQLADDLGVDLVRVVSFSENGTPVPYYGRGLGGDMAVLEEAMEATAPAIPVGENSITSHVSITYEIK